MLHLGRSQRQHLRSSLPSFMPSVNVSWRFVFVPFLCADGKEKKQRMGREMDGGDWKAWVMTSTFQSWCQLNHIRDGELTPCTFHHLPPKVEGPVSYNQLVAGETSVCFFFSVRCLVLRGYGSREWIPDQNKMGPKPLKFGPRK